ncbi:aldo/keto reductase [candidate division CSSED10-310 bacterium]|uniref:Aldo/keto reductase n=1 Tax=candidate division CSSED10-310 bacterium TaxID=2855610 RepID=A0ABV6Z6I7_UNCC1
MNWFDTAEAYGQGQSERTLAHALQSAGKSDGEVIIATKWWPMFRFASSIKNTIEDRLSCLENFSIDLHQVHQPFSFSAVPSEMEAMADLVAAGKIRAIGVSNFSASDMGRADRALHRRGLFLASNQVKYSLLDRRIESNGILATAKALDITLIAYSPLEQGLLTGKFHRNPDLLKELSGLRKWMPSFRTRKIKRSLPLIEALEEIGAAHGVTPANVALNWLVHFHGETIVAIPGATKVKQAADNVAALNFELSPKELSRIDQLSREFRYG